MKVCLLTSAGDRNRTYNLRFTKPLLCQLSYAGMRGVIFILPEVHSPSSRLPSLCGRLILREVFSEYNHKHQPPIFHIVSSFASLLSIPFSAFLPHIASLLISLRSPVVVETAKIRVKGHSFYLGGKEMLTCRWRFVGDSNS